MRCCRFGELRLLLHFPLLLRSERLGEPFGERFDRKPGWKKFEREVRAPWPRRLPRSKIGTRESHELLRALFPYSGRAGIVGLRVLRDRERARSPIS